MIASVFIVKKEMEENNEKQLNFLEEIIEQGLNDGTY